MQFTLIMARGIEGTGNTKFTIELHEYLKSQGHAVRTYANNEKKWGRKDAHENEIIEVDFRQAHQLADMERYMMASDQVLIMSVPAKKYTTDGKLNFMNVLRSAKNKDVKLTYIQVDHKIHSINRNFYQDDAFKYDFFELLDLIVTHTDCNDFVAKFIHKHKIDANIKSMTMISTDFSEIAAKYWKPFDEKRERSAMFMGRSARWKGFHHARDFHHNWLKDNHYVSSMEGMEMSIGYLDEFLSCLKPRTPRNDVFMCLDKENFAKYIDVFDRERNQEIYVFGPYIKSHGLHRMSQNQFGMFFTYLGEQYDGPLENTLLEIIAVGTIPIVTKQFAEAAMLRPGKKLIDFPFEMSGTLIYDSEDPFCEENRKLVAHMNMLSNNEIAYDAVRTQTFAFYKAYFDRDFILARLTKLLTEEN